MIVDSVNLVFVGTPFDGGAKWMKYLCKLLNINFCLFTELLYKSNYSYTRKSCLSDSEFHHVIQSNITLFLVCSVAERILYGFDEYSDIQHQYTVDPQIVKLIFDRGLKQN